MADAELAPPPPPYNVQPGDYLVVVHAHSGGEDELTMHRNDIIQLVELDEEFGDGWWLGEYPGTNQKGLFPAGFTRKAERYEYSGYQNALRIDPSPQGIIASEKTESPAQIEPTTPKEMSFSAFASEQTTPQASRQTPVPGAPQTMESPSQRSASSPLPYSSLAADIQNALRPSADQHVNGQDSPVMNETLSVIDEHITDMNTPRHSVSTQDAKTINDSGSEYSTHISHRMSYINGNETDEEELTTLTEEQVRRWNQVETANHLRNLGVDSKHCDIFENEEITGDVLLEMNQDFVFMKEFDFGVMGKRLKTWHKIKALQEEVNMSKQQQQQQQQTHHHHHQPQQTPQTQTPRGSVASSYPNPHDERSMSRTGHPTGFLPRIPTVSEKTGAGYVPRSSMGPTQHPRLASNGSSPSTPMTPPRYDSRRMSAASIREFNHGRRHSSIDATQRGYSDLHGRTLCTTPRPGTSVGTPTEGYRAFRGAIESEPNTPEGNDDLDRGYFSGTEVDSRKNRRVLQKRTSTAGSNTHSRKSSYNQEEPIFMVKPPKRQSRIASVDSLRDADKHVSVASKNYNDSPAKSRLRSLSQRNSSSQSGRTSQSSDTKPGFFASFGPLIAKKGTDSESSSARSSHFQPLRNVGPKMRRAVGMRAISDAANKDTSAPESPKEFDASFARTGSTTPSATSKSSERHSTDGSGKAGEPPGFVVRPRTVKSKKETSAYTQGLEKKAPQEQISGCDYSGWMKKRSSNLMTTWKPRLFVLRGRRLSYYYSEDDTEERGLIDITAHRVLRADNDPIITLHAAVTGSTALPANASSTDQSAKLASSDPISGLKSKDLSGPFFFKLVPPKMGNSRAVQFTKPTTHYFQVDSVQEGRLWMGALMKATIERDLDQVVSSTNKQKTISLKQARLMNQRPPALMTNPLPESEKLVEEEEEDDGLRIEGLNLTKSGSSEGNSYVDAKNELNETDSTSNDLAMSNPLGEINTGPTFLIPSPLGKTDSE
ncbi:Sterile alpha motif type 2 [Penicillium verhagenii]|nr:Sterile alpha motif type 2 [Penicillium verhagenii]